MVDISAKRVTFRRAVASAEVEMSEATWRMLAAGGLPKGDALAAARVAGIQAAKRTWELIPLCHPLALEGVEVELGLERPGRVWIVATVRVRGRTGAEMEALTAAVAAALTIYDMCKSVERGMRIGRVQLLEKSGGRSGRWSRESGAR